MSRPAFHFSTIAALAFAVLPFPSAVIAQTVRGEVVDAETGQALVGSVVVLVDSAGAAALSMLTNGAGRFQGTAPHPGTYGLRVERIGYETVMSGPVVLSAGTDVFERIQVAVVPITLSGLVIAAERRCVVRPGAAAVETGRVWEQARIALSAAVETQRQRTLRFDTELYVRELDAQTLRIQDEQRTVRRGGFLLPFGTRDPDDLFQNGFVQAAEGGRYFDFYAPTAEVLLSDAFLDTHCFRLAAGADENAGLIGLEFEPVRKRAVSDVEGTLWLDPSSSLLRHVELRYVASDPRMPVEGALSRVEFQRLPDGRWIVGRWFIRMPVIVEQQVRGGFLRSRPSRSVASFRQEGGEVTRIVTADGQPISAAARVAVTGVVYDSLGGRPLRLARVSLEGTGYRTVADADGRFSFDGIPAGRYSVRIDHALLDSLPEAARPSAEIDVTENGSVELALGVPSRPTVMEATCPGLWETEAQVALPGVMNRLTGNAVLYGVIRDADGQPVPGATANVSWDAFRIENRDEKTRVQVREIVPSTTADGQGRFVICGVPADARLSVWATLGDATGPITEVRTANRFAFAVAVLRSRRPDR